MLTEFSADENLKKFTTLAFPGTDRYDITKLMSKLQDALVRYNLVRDAGASPQSLLKVRDIIKRQLMNTLGNNKRIANLAHTIFQDIDKNTAYLYEGTRDFISRIERMLEEAHTVITRENYITPMTTGKTAQQLRNSGTHVIEKALKDTIPPDEMSTIFLDAPKRMRDIDSVKALQESALQDVHLLNSAISQHIKDNSVLGDMFIYTGVRDLVNEIIVSETIDVNALRQIYNVLDITNPSRLNKDMLSKLSTHDINNIQQLNQRFYNLLDMYENMEYNELSVTIDNLASNVDTLKLSQAEALKTILSNPVITDALSQILNKGDLGLVTELLAASDNATVAQVAEDLRSLASSSWIMTRFNQQLEDAGITDAWKSAIYDTLAGMMRMEIDEINPIIEWLSKGITIEAGDLIATGTPDGVGMGRNPPEYLQDGDVLETEIEGIGVLRNTIVG
jgi:hypothetical protein